LPHRRSTPRGSPMADDRRPAPCGNSTATTVFCLLNRCSVSKLVRRHSGDSAVAASCGRRGRSRPRAIGTGRHAPSPVSCRPRSPCSGHRTGDRRRISPGCGSRAPERGRAGRLALAGHRHRDHRSLRGWALGASAAGRPATAAVTAATPVLILLGRRGYWTPFLSARPAAHFWAGAWRAFGHSESDCSRGRRRPAPPSCGRNSQRRVSADRVRPR